MFQKIFWYNGKFLHKMEGGGKRISSLSVGRQSFLAQCRKISWANTPVVQKVSGINDFHAREGERCHEFPSDFFLSHSTKNFVWEIFRTSENF